MSSVELVFAFIWWRKLSGIWIALNKVIVIDILVVFFICSFCKKDLEVLNCHSWRCKEELKNQRNEGNHANDIVSNNFNTVNPDRNEILNNDCTKCICGKKCKGLRGLKVHQRSCRAIISLNNNRQFRLLLNWQFRTRCNRKPLCHNK